MLRLRIKIVIAVAAVMLILLPVICFAHSGRTDEYGGHYDNIHGGYHYHHGFPAHQHPNGKCPYLQQQDDNVADSQQQNAGNDSADDSEPLDLSKFSLPKAPDALTKSYMQKAYSQSQTQSKEIKHESVTAEDIAVAAITTVIIFIIVLLLLHRMTR